MCGANAVIIAAPLGARSHIEVAISTRPTIAVANGASAPRARARVTKTLMAVRATCARGRSSARGRRRPASRRSRRPGRAARRGRSSPCPDRSALQDPVRPASQAWAPTSRPRPRRSPSDHRSRRPAPWPSCHRCSCSLPVLRALLRRSLPAGRGPLEGALIVRVVGGRVADPGVATADAAQRDGEAAGLERYYHHVDGICTLAARRPTIWARRSVRTQRPCVAGAAAMTAPASQSLPSVSERQGLSSIPESSRNRHREGPH